jgi:alcohol dehydrogenase (cytochrome c)
MRHVSVLIFAAALLPAQTGRPEFEARCAACHGADGAGGERGPSITGSRGARRRSEADWRELIRRGIPQGGMPGFDLPDAEMGRLVTFVRSLVSPAIENPAAGDEAAGEKFFWGAGRCGECHTVAGRGTALGPDLSEIARDLTLPQIEEALRRPEARIAPGYRAATVRLRSGSSVRGLVKNESNYDVQLQSLDGKLHLLKRHEIAGVESEGKSLMPAVSGPVPDLLAFLSRLGGARAPSGGGPPGTLQAKLGDWPTYHGNLSGNRHSPLDQIHTGNVAALAVKWLFPIPTCPRLQVTPVVIDSILYATCANEAYALDARSGRLIWQYRRPRTRGVIGDAGSGINRGVAVLGNRLFLVTDHAHLLALERFTGRLLWEVEMADYRQHYGATSAPLVVGDLVVAGISGGDEGARGFLSAYRASSGEQAWKFWTVPAPGEPGSETWKGKAWERGCGTTWLTGTYDPDLNLLYWTTGNPCPDYNGDERQGDNLYTSSVLALEPATGKLRWYYQYTPHDLHDWDAQQTPMLIDTTWQGRPRKLLAQANRNGFFYVLDRTDGKLLLAKPFVEKLTWATGIGPDGRPQLVAGTIPTPEGNKACPAVEGATNWFSTAFHPGTRLFYVQALEKCTIYTKSAEWFQPGRSFYGGSTRQVPGEPGRKILRALDIETGRIVWEYPQIGPANTWGGVLSTAGGLVFFGDDSGAFAALEAKTGRPLWHFHTNQTWKASPMTYLVDGKQYVAVAAGSNLLAFGLP